MVSGTLNLIPRKGCPCESGWSTKEGNREYQAGNRRLTKYPLIYIKNNHFNQEVAKFFMEIFI